MKTDKKKKKKLVKAGSPAMAIFIILAMSLSFYAEPSSAWSWEEILGGIKLPKAAFISYTVPFEQEKTLYIDERCSNRPSVGINNQERIPVETATVLITITRVDNPINQMHIGKQRQTTPVEIIDSSDCEVYGSVCSNYPVTAFKSYAWSDLGKGIDGICT